MAELHVPIQISHFDNSAVFSPMIVTEFLNRFAHRLQEIQDGRHCVPLCPSQTINLPLKSQIAGTQSLIFVLQSANRRLFCRVLPEQVPMVCFLR
jgi:hypothetical protein